MTEKQQTLYPDYDVLALQDEWDEHTRDIVLQSLNPPSAMTILNDWEQQMIAAIAQHLIYDNRKEIIAWIVAHIDSELAQPVGESQRKPGTPPQKQLVLEGIQALEHWAHHHSGQSFLESDAAKQCAILSSLQLGQLPTFDQWNAPLQKDLFTKLAGMVISAYYSHPTVWSEIGYGGPAYPRGYVRIELGLVDPWEPQHKEGQHGK